MPLKERWGGWRDGRVVKRTSCSLRGPPNNHMVIHSHLQWNLMPSSGIKSKERNVSRMVIDASSVIQFGGRQYSNVSCYLESLRSLGLYIMFQYSDALCGFCLSRLQVLGQI